MNQISAPELAAWLSDEQRPQPVLLDVRELSELQICQIPGSVHMAMHTVPLRHAELDPQTPIVCICHHGGRSMQVANYLLQNGFDQIINLTGGVHAWATLVDTSMARY